MSLSILCQQTVNEEDWTLVGGFPASANQWVLSIFKNDQRQSVHTVRYQFKELGTSTSHFQHFLCDYLVPFNQTGIEATALIQTILEQVQEQQRPCAILHLSQEAYLAADELLDVRKLKARGLETILAPGYQVGCRYVCYVWQKNARVSTALNERYPWVSEELEAPFIHSFGHSLAEATLEFVVRLFLHQQTAANREFLGRLPLTVVRRFIFALLGYPLEFEHWQGRFDLVEPR